MGELQTPCSCAAPPPSLPLPGLLPFPLSPGRPHPASLPPVLFPAAEPDPARLKHRHGSPGPHECSPAPPSQAPSASSLVPRCPIPDGPSVKPPLPVLCTSSSRGSGCRLAWDVLPGSVLNPVLTSRSSSEPLLPSRRSLPDAWRAVAPSSSEPRPLLSLLPDTVHLGHSGRVWARGRLHYCCRPSVPLCVPGSSHGVMVGRSFLPSGIGAQK